MSSRATGASSSRSRTKWPTHTGRAERALARPSRRRSTRFPEPLAAPTDSHRFAPGAQNAWPPVIHSGRALPAAVIRAKREREMAASPSEWRRAVGQAAKFDSSLGLAVGLEPSQRILIEHYAMAWGVDRGWQLDVELGRVVEEGGRLEWRVVEHVPSTGTIVGDEGQVRADHLDPVERVGKAEPDDRARDVVEIAYLLL